MPPGWACTGTLALAALAAWLGLARAGSAAILGVALVAVGYGAALTLTPG